MDDISLDLVLYEEYELLVGFFSCLFTAVDIFRKNVVFEEDIAYHKSTPVPLYLSAIVEKLEGEILSF